MWGRAGWIATIVVAVAACSDGVAQRQPIVQALFAEADQVMRLDIEIGPDDVDLMLADLVTQGKRPLVDRDFEYFECTVRFQDTIFEHVGIRLKGASSLIRPHNDGYTKLPYKLDFDKFAKHYPETAGRTLLGMEKINLTNGFRDSTLLRDILASELLLEFGAHTARTRPCAVYVNGAFRGLFVMIEQIDETFLRDRFGNDTGNLYKPFAPHAALTRFRPKHLVKKTNEADADWSDIREFIQKLNDPDVGISTIFDVDSYLANPHNYYLYNNPATGLFHFISWDHNGCFGASLAIGYGPSIIHTYSVDVPSIPGTPLVERVLAVPEYRQRYEALIDRLALHPMGFGSRRFAACGHASLGADGAVPGHAHVRHQRFRSQSA